MPTLERLASHLPHLRRFARALSGNQASGDAYVASLLELLIEDPSQLDADLDTRTAFYRAFLRIWNSIEVNGKTDPAGLERDAPVDRRLGQMTPKPRQAFLLCAAEDFSTEEAAKVLDVPRAELEALLDTAGREIAQQIATNVLIIEDEPMIAFDLEGVVESLGHSVVAIARTRKDAVKAAEQGRPGLVLADIQLADGTSGVNAVNDLLEFLEVPVVFITAYPERLLTGKRPEPTFLIRKPYRAEDVKAVISQALFFDRKAHRDQQSATASA